MTTWDGKPAMSAEQWRFLKAGNVYLALGTMDAIVSTDGGVCGVPIKNRHGTAALCLKDQPYGFTREDVRNLLWLVEETSGNYDDVWAAGLAARIAALLPPEEE